MSNIFLKNVSNLPLTIPSGDLTGLRPSTIVVASGGVFFGDANNFNVNRLVAAGYLVPVTGSVMELVPADNLPTPVSGAFVGEDNAGPGSVAITMAGALIGKRVYFIVDVTGADTTPAAHFESTISVSGQIKQTFVGDLSASKYAVLVL